MSYIKRHDYRLYYWNGKSEVFSSIPHNAGSLPWLKLADAHIVIDLTSKEIIKNRYATQYEAIKFICSLKSKYVRRIFKKRFLKLYGGS